MYYGSRFPPRGARIPQVIRERVPVVRYDRNEMRRGRFPCERCFGVDFPNLSFEQMARHWFDSFGQPSGRSFAFSHGRF